MCFFSVKRTRRAMSLVGIPVEDQDAVFRTIAAVLHLGNVTFLDNADDAAGISSGEGEESLAVAAELLCVDAEGLRRILTTRTRQTPEGPIVSPIDVKSAEDNRDSLSKMLYSRLFDWLVERINASIGQDPSANSIIGVLDIYGFEQFKTNDFEQFCINLANEKLQQHFNQHVFKMEQAEYAREEIEWSYIEFVDNQDVLDLIEGRMGVLDLLDESCRFPKATHEDFAQKLSSTTTVADSARFSKPRLAQTDFTLAHYAGSVTYRTNNFLVKNRDFIVAEHQLLMGSSSLELVRSLFPSQDASDVTPNARGPASSYKFSSVGSQFKRQLGDLMETLHAMEPHYIRCIKPNSINVPMEFENSNVLHQLRCGGVLEAVRISCAGYPSKPRYEEFVDHFWPLAVNALDLDDRAITQQIVRGVLGDEGYQFGQTRVFLRAGKMAQLDKRRTDVLNAAAAMIQRAARGFMARLEFTRTRNATLVIQSVFRGHMARCMAAELRENRAAVRIQTAWRRYCAQKNLRSAVLAVIAIQRAWQAYQTRKAAVAAQRESAATLIQANWRRYVAQEEYIQTRRGIIAAQTAWRCKLAKREMRRRRAEARESTKLLQDKQALEGKLQEVQNVLANLKNQRSELRQQLRDEKLGRESAEARVLEAEAAAARDKKAVEQEAAVRIAEAMAAKSSLAQQLAALQAEVSSKVEASSAQQARAAAEAEGLRGRVSALERQLKETENAARSHVEDLMNRLNNAVAQRNQAREEALMLAAKLEQLQKEVAAGRVSAAAAGAGAAPVGAGHLVASAVSPIGRSAQPGMSPLGPAHTPPVQMVPGGRTFEGAGTDKLSDMDRRQRELYARQQQLLREQRTADQERLLSALKTDLGFQKGRPIAAVLVFRCCLQWKAFQADRTPLFDRINATMGEQVEAFQEDNGRLAYWLSNTVALLYLMQTLIKPASASAGYAARLRQSGQQAAKGLFGSAGKTLGAVFGRGVAGINSPGEEASIHGGAAGGMRQVEAKYPALLFKQQLDAFVQRIFPMLRDNVKKEISPHLSACIHAPRSAHGGRGTRKHVPAGGADGGATTAPPADGSSADPWRHILGVFDALLETLRANNVPAFLVCKLFEQLFSFVNVQLFNQLLLRRECCSFSNGEYVKTGLSEVELWVGRAGRQWLGEAWEQLAHIRQAVTFLVIHQKAKKSLHEITSDLCPVLSVQQLYRISTMYWDDRYGTETVSHEVLARMKQLMVEGTSSGAASFLLDEDSNIPFSQEDIAVALGGQDLLSETVCPEALRDVPSFAFLAKRPELALQAANV
jgi:myosin V